MRRLLLAPFVAFLALGAELPGAEPSLAIATFQADVTPPLGSPLCDGAVEAAKQIVDRLTARGVVLLSAGSPIVLCAVDWVGIANEGHDAWRKALADAAGTTVDRVMVHTLHQHDAPGCDFLAAKLLSDQGLAGSMFDVSFARQAIARTAEAVQQAVRRPRRVTHVGFGRGKVEQVASNRRVLGPDGKVRYVRYSSCRDEAARAAPEGTIDPYVQLVSFWDGPDPIAVLSYYATHPQSYYGEGGVSADFVGMARALCEQALPGVAHIHFDGAGGNVAAGKYNDGAPANRPLLAGRLAAGMKAAWDATTRLPIQAADVRWGSCEVRLPLSDRFDEAALQTELADRQRELRHRIRAATDLAWLERVRSGHAIEIGCLRLGPAYVLHMPGELFVEYQLAAQELLPTSPVLMAAYGDYGPGYIGTEIAYSQGGYETGIVSRVSPRVDAVLMKALRELLK